MRQKAGEEPGNEATLVDHCHSFPSAVWKWRWRGLCFFGVWVRLLLVYGKYRLLHSSRLPLQTWEILPTITEVKAQGDYTCIMKVCKQLRDLLECNHRLRLWVQFHCM